MSEPERPSSVSVKCALVVRGAFDAHVIPACEAEALQLSIDWAPTTVIVKKLEAGETADVVIVVSAAMDRLIAEGRIEASSRIDIVRSRYAVAVRAGHRHPAIESVEALKSSLLAARSVAYSRTGASGIYFAGLLQKLGIADAVNARATIIPQGFTAEMLVSGEADVAVQQMSELMVIPGIEVVGAFPDPVQEETMFSAALMAGVASSAAARFLDLLTTPGAATAYRRSGLEPSFPRPAV